MEEHRVQTDIEPSFDRTQAEEALLIAARLQQEQRDRLTLSELKRTAAEVDIAPEFVEQALAMLKNRPAHRTPAKVEASLTVWVQGMLALAVILVQVELARSAAPTPVLMVLPTWGLAVLLAAALGVLLPRGRNTTVLGVGLVGFASGAVVTAFLVFARHRVHGYYFDLEIERLLVLFLVEATAFLAARQFRRSAGEAPPPATDNLARSNGL